MDSYRTLFTDADRVARRIREDIAPQVGADAADRNARENTFPTARLAHDQGVAHGDAAPPEGGHPGPKQFVENESFKRFVGDMVYAITNAA